MALSLSNLQSLPALQIMLEFNLRKGDIFVCRRIEVRSVNEELQDKNKSKRVVLVSIH